MLLSSLRTVTRRLGKLGLAAAMFGLALTVSAQSPEVRVLPDLNYTLTKPTVDMQERCKLDLYLPAKPKDFPSLVWFHGGGLTGGHKGTAPTVAVARSLAESGVAVAVVNYRLSPKAKYPAYIEDAAAAFAWTKKHIAEYGGDANRVFMGGHSAGAYLTLMAGLDDRYLAEYRLNLSDIAGLIPVAGQTLTHYTIRVERGLPKETIIADDAAPLHHTRKDAPPILILYAEKDMAMRAEENELFAAAMRAAGHSATTIHKIKDRDHGSVGHNLAAADDAGRELVLSFIRKHVSPAP